MPPNPGGARAYQVTSSALLTLDSTKLYAGSSASILIFMAAVLVWGYWMARGGKAPRQAAAT